MTAAAIADCDRSRRAAHQPSPCRPAPRRRSTRAPHLCAAPLRAAPPSDTPAPRRRRRCRTGRSSPAREPTRHR
eukprot:535686-Prymnesium_polylepis.1